MSTHTFSISKVILLALTGLAVVATAKDDPKHARYAMLQSGADARRIRDEAERAKAAEEARSKQADADAQMRQWMEMNKPGEHHALLKRLTGEWDAEVEMTMPPGAAAQKSKGKVKSEMVLDGRYLHSDFTGEMFGQPFHGMGLMGYDNLKKKYFQAFIDQMSTGLMLAEGTSEKDGKVIAVVGNEVDPANNQKRQFRWVTTLIDDSKYTFESFEPTPDGKGEFRSMLIRYTRSK